MIFIQLTGLSGAGKSTLANHVKSELERSNVKAEVVDGDQYRQTLCKDLGFSKEDRQENIRRLGTLCGTLSKHGIVTIMSAINPYDAIRQELKTMFNNVYVVWVNCDIPTLIQRDTKGLYQRALLPDGHPEKIHNLTGINDTYEIPENPDLIINTNQLSIAESTQCLLRFITTKIAQRDLPVHSSSPKAMFVGRWQPFHNGHKWIIEQKLAKGIPVLIAIRDVIPDEKNPLTAGQTLSLIQKVYEKNPLVSTMVIPDIESINYGRNVGYEVNEIVPPPDIHTISASEVRSRFKQGLDTWKQFIDPSIHDLLAQYLKESPY